MASWLDISRHAEPNTKAVLVHDLPACGAQPLIPAGTRVAVVENSLNEMQPAIVLQAEGDDGEIWVPGPDHGDVDHWDQEAPIVLLRP